MEGWALSRTTYLTLTWAALLAGALSAQVALFGGLRPEPGVALTLALVAVGAVAYASEVVVRQDRAHLDAGMAVALCALVLAGPLVAFCVLLVPEVVDRARTRAVATQATLRNAAAYACATLAGALLLEPRVDEGLATVFAVGWVLLSVNFLVGPFLLTAVGRRLGAREALAPFREAAFAQLVLVAVATATTQLVGALGILGLVAFCAAVPAPQLALGALARARPARELDRAAATRLYGLALADVLQLDRHARHVLAATLGLILDGRTMRGTGELVAHEAALAKLHVEERWDGRGRPAGLAGDRLPEASRVVAVAGAWAELTAAGGLQLSHSEARLDLAAQAGTRFDPRVVEAVEAVVEAERALSPEPAAQPRLHRLRLPRLVRRRVLPALAGA